MAVGADCAFCLFCGLPKDSDLRQDCDVRGCDFSARRSARALPSPLSHEALARDHFAMRMLLAGCRTALTLANNPLDQSFAQRLARACIAQIGETIGLPPSTTATQETSA